MILIVLVWTVDIVYANALKAEGLITDADIKGWEKEYMDTLNKHFELAKKITKLSIMAWIDTPWTGWFQAVDQTKVRHNTSKLQNIESKLMCSCKLSLCVS